MGAVDETVDLRALLRLSSAAPLGIRGDTVLVLCDLPGTAQLFRASLSGGELEQLTDFPDPVHGKLVPGSDRILVEHDEAGNENVQLSLLIPGGSTEPLVRDPRFFHREPHFSRDGALIAYSSNREDGVNWGVYVRSAADGSERTVVPPTGPNAPAGFSPQAELLAVFRETRRANDIDLLLVDLRTGDIEHVNPRDDEAEVGEPVWAPDGRSLVVATNEGRDTKAIARYDIEARRWETVVESDWDLECYGDHSGRRLLVEANEDGYSRLELRDPGTFTVDHEVPLPGRGVVEEPVFCEDGSVLAFKFSSPVDPGDVWAYDIEARELSRVTELARPGDLATLREPELHRFESFDGLSVPTFLWEPDGDGPFPVVVMVHGGPAVQFRPSFLPSFTPFTQHLVSLGYAVAAPNVRGSKGYGKRYEHLDDVRLRLDSVRDLAALHDWLETRPRIDASRAALYGRSYGGYMTLAGLAFQPERWAAGVECVGIANFVTFLENTAAWRRAVREPEYGTLEDDRDFLVEASPITHVDAIRAPLFVQHGANDPRVPLVETQQIHRVLTEKGIRCDVLVHENEGHLIGKLENRIETFERATQFLQEVL